MKIFHYHDQRVTWFGILKNGTWSIHDFFGDPPLNVWIPPEDPNLRKNWFESKWLFFASDIIFTVKRNPYDRYISAWYYLKRDGYIPSNFIFESNWNLWEYYHSLKDDSESKKLIYHHLFYSQWETINEFFPYLTHIIEMENIEEELQPITKLFGITKKFPHLNITKHPNRREIITDEIKSFIDKEYHMDFIKFGYEKIL